MSWTKRTKSTVRAAQEDLELLNSSLAGEHFGVAAYEAAISTGLLDDGVVDVARAFQADHRRHAERLTELVVERGGTPVAARAMEAYVAELPPLSSQEDVLRYAVYLERTAASADIDAVGRYQDRELARVAAQIAGDEAMHWSVLLGALGENPVPVSFIPLPAAA